MRQLFSAIWSQLRSQKKTLFAVLVFACVFALIPLTTEAGLGETIKNAFVDGILAAINAVIAFFKSINEFIFLAIAKVVMTIIRHVVGMGVAPNASITPIFVTDSWNTVRQLVNMFFILILVFIGLATILRIQTYQLQKTLPALIVMALLVNFSGVFVGFIVDMSNLVTMYFLDKAAEADWKAIASAFTPGASVISQIASNIASIIYFLVASLIYVVLILVFVVRTMFLWVLVILAPLAFASYILPATKGKIWDEWWKQLIQWSIFAIPVAFFLWLAKEVLDVGAMGGITQAPTNVSVLANLLAPFTALFILYLGVTTSQAMAPKMATTVADFGKKWSKNIGRLGGRGAWKFRGIGPLKMEKSLGENLERLGGGLRRRFEPRPLQAIQSDLAAKRKEYNDMMTTARTQGFTPQTTVRIQKLRGDMTQLQKQEQKAKGPRRVADTVGYYTGGLLARWAGRAVERGSGAITAQVVKKDSTDFAQAQADAQNASRRAETSLDVMAAELLKPEWARDKAKIAGTIAGMRLRQDWDEIEAAVEKKLMFTWEQIGKNVLVEVSNALGSYGRRPMTLGNAGRLLARPKELGFDAEPVYGDPDNPTRVTGFETLKGKREGDKEFKGSDAEWLTANVLEDVFRRLQPDLLRNNATAPLGNYEPLDIRINVDGTVSFTDNARSSQAFEQSALFSGRPEVWEAILGLRERDRARAAANLWRNVNPFSLVNQGAGKFITWSSTSTNAGNLGIKSRIDQQLLANLVAAIETKELTRDNLAINPANPDTKLDAVRETYQEYVQEGQSMLRQSILLSHNERETAQILNLLKIPPTTPTPAGPARGQRRAGRTPLRFEDT